jgi:hypothetical protein
MPFIVFYLQICTNKNLIEKFINMKKYLEIALMSGVGVIVGFLFSRLLKYYSVEYDVLLEIISILTIVLIASVWAGIKNLSRNRKK